MNARFLKIFSFLVLMAVIGIISWHDLHPPALHQVASAEMPSYYADANATLALVPDDDYPVIIEQGSLSDGKLVRRGMAPITIAQRQLSLLLHFDSLPEKPADAFSAIKGLVAEWEAQGDIVTTVFFDYRPKNVDFKAYAAFIAAARKSFEQDPHPFVPVANADWPKGAALLQEEVPFFLIDLTDKKMTPELLQNLENFGPRFQIRFPAGVIAGDIDLKPLLGIPSFSGCMFTLSAQKPWPKKEEKIGLWPKFLKG